MEAEDETKVVERDLSDAEDADAKPAPSDEREESDSDDVSADASASDKRRALDDAVNTDLADAGSGRSPPPSRSGAASIDLLTSHRLVGRYELIHRLGYGGMATVYLGRAIGTAGFERLVAVKVIHPHLANEPEFVEMFLDEARIAAKIHHPHVVEIIDLGQDEELFFMVMEYVEGDNLAALIRELRKRDETIAVSAALQITSDVCRGLVAAHDLKEHDGTRLELVHRDVSPHNFLISMDGRVRVVDFGIMKAAGKRSTTLTGQLRGKVPYMSPEQAKAKSVDHRTDIFALGAVLWEMLAGERLFIGETESETLAKVVACKVPDVFERRDDLPEELRPILDKALAPNPGDRYDSAQAMLKDVRAVLRQLDDDEPREVLAGYMKRFFQTRIDYIHATIRGYTAGDDPSRSASMSEGMLSKTSALAPGSSSAPLAHLTPSHPPLGPQTLTTPGMTARQWPLWLLLPLAGAVIGTLVVRTWDSDPVDSRGNPAPAADMTPARTEQPRETVVDPSAAVDKVKWWFNTDPQGATVYIDGEPQATVTPLAVELPRGDEPVAVRVVKEGYTPRNLQLAPLGNQNVPVRLEKLPAADSEESAGDKPPKAMPRFKARTRPKSTSAKDPETSPSAETPKPDTKSSDEPVPGEVPDYNLVRKKKAP